MKQEIYNWPRRLVDSSPQPWPEIDSESDSEPEKLEVTVILEDAIINSAGGYYR